MIQEGRSDEKMMGTCFVRDVCNLLVSRQEALDLVPDQLCKDSIAVGEFWPRSD